MEEVVRQALQESQKVLSEFLQAPESVNQIVRAGKILSQCFEKQGRAFACGNGGSMSDAMHFAEELSGRFRNDRRALPAQAISDPGHLSCVANDFGWEHVFSRYLEAHARAGDVLVAISTSGKSPNVLRAAQYARDHQISVITLTGKSNSALGQLATVDICAPGGAFADRAQEIHIKIIHALIEIVERTLFPKNY
ncbi:MAG: SIS domain-containing protein [Bdellovibrionales bacterium]|nr:SIS domain-containing protein [Bdellovibrionales bacterium]